MENNQYNDITISPADNMQHVNISRQLTDNQTIRLSLIIRVPTTVYIDNISLTNP